MLYSRSLLVVYFMYSGVYMTDSRGGDSVRLQRPGHKVTGSSCLLFLLDALLWGKL